MIKLLILLMTLCSTPSSAMTVEEAQQSVFPLCSDGGCGTGFELAVAGEVLTVTNAHVCETSTLPFLIAKLPEASVRLKIAYISESADLCLLEGVTGLVGLKIAEVLDEKSELTALGHVKGELHVTLGEFKDPSVIMHRMPGYKDGRRVYPTSSITNPIMKGDSGAPVLDTNGEVVGVVYAIWDGHGLVVPHAYLHALVKMLTKVLLEGSQDGGDQDSPKET